jgi:DNA ligase (NAD+)
VAELEPVECSGVTISNATLHNFDEINRLGVRVGDKVVLERAGDVIPKVVKVVESARTGQEKKFKLPERCPFCSGEIIKEKEEEVAYRCSNMSCPAQIEKKLLHFASRPAMDIEGMGEAVVRQLIGKGMVEDFADLYFLKESDLLTIELFKEKKARNLVKGIEMSKTRSLSRLLFAFGIRHVGEKAAQVLAERFHAMDRLARAESREISAIHEIGEVIAASVYDFFRQKETKRWIEKLRKARVNMVEPKRTGTSSKLAGQVFVLTGELEGFSRHQASERLKLLGASVSSSVSKKTSCVVVGAHPGSKYELAKKFKIPVLDEKAFGELLGESL